MLPGDEIRVSIDLRASLKVNLGISIGAVLSFVAGKVMEADKEAGYGFAGYLFGCVPVAFELSRAVEAICLSVEGLASCFVIEYPEHTGHIDYEVDDASECERAEPGEC